MDTSGEIESFLPLAAVVGIITDPLQELDGLALLGRGALRVNVG
jgi:hypothetical protein